MVMVMALYVPWSLIGCEVIIKYLTIFLVVELSYALQVGTYGERTSSHRLTSRLSTGAHRQRLSLVSPTIVTRSRMLNPLFEVL
jgi:hypothetical protein